MSSRGLIKAVDHGDDEPFLCQNSSITNSSCEIRTHNTMCSKVKKNIPYSMYESVVFFLTVDLTENKQNINS